MNEEIFDKVTIDEMIEKIKLDKTARDNGCLRESWQGRFHYEGTFNYRNNRLVPFTKPRPQRIF